MSRAVVLAFSGIQRFGFLAFSVLLCFILVKIFSYVTEVFWSKWGELVRSSQLSVWKWWCVEDSMGNAVRKCIIISGFIKIQSAVVDLDVTHLTNRSEAHGGCLCIHSFTRGLFFIECSSRFQSFISIFSPLSPGFLCGGTKDGNFSRIEH